MLISRSIKHYTYSVFRLSYLIKLCALGVMVPSLSFGRELWATGVTQSSGWTYTPGYGSGYCWASVCTDMLFHWQNELQKTYELPLNVPKTASDINRALIDAFPNTPGYWVREGIKWYTETYFPTLQLPMADVQPKPYSPYATEWCDEDNLEAFSARLLRVFEYGEGPIALGLANFRHTITLWGAQFNDSTGLLEKIWVTDTTAGNNLQERLVWDIPEELRNDYKGYSILFGTEGTSGSISWDDIPLSLDYLTTRLKDLNGNTPTSLIPEPVTASLSLWGFGLLTLRRRR